MGLVNVKCISGYLDNDKKIQNPFSSYEEQL